MSPVPTNTTTSGKVYKLNWKGEPNDKFKWVEAFETWSQRKKVHLTWKFDPLNGSTQWSVTVTFSGHTYNGVGATKQHAKEDAVIRIENANILPK